MGRFFKDLKKYGNYIVYAAKASLKGELDGSRIGWIWWILEPVMFMLIYMFVFVTLFKRTTEYLVAFIFIGISIWRVFTGTVQGCVQLIKRNRNVMSKVYLPKFSLVLINLLTNGVKLMFSFVIVAGLMVYYKISPSFYMLQLIPVLAVLFLITFGMRLLVMHIGVYFEDLANFLRPAFQLLFYASGVFYPLNRAWDEAAVNVIHWLNPIALILNAARNALLYKEVFNWIVLFCWALIGALVTAVSLSLIYRSENEYVKIV